MCGQADAVLCTRADTRISSHGIHGGSYVQDPLSFRATVEPKALKKLDDPPFFSSRKLKMTG